MSLNNSYIQNKGYPSDVQTGAASTCPTSRQSATALTTEYTIEKVTTDVSWNKPRIKPILIVTY